MTHSLTIMTTARAQQLACEAASSATKIDTSLAIAQQLADALIQERKRSEIWEGPRHYSVERHLTLAEALGIVLCGIVQREAELSEIQMQETVDIAKRIAA